jgi:hypothetical protein
MQECGFPETVPIELEVRKRPGRPPVHVWVDLPDELLSPEQKRKKRAILLRRARQQRLYERRKALRAAVAQKQQASGTGTGVPARSSSAISTRQYCSRLSGADLRTNAAAARVADALGRLVNDDVAGGVGENGAFSALKTLDQVERFENTQYIATPAQHPISIQHRPSFIETMISASGTGEHFPAPMTTNQRHLLQKIAVYDIAAGMRAQDDQGNNGLHHPLPGLHALGQHNRLLLNTQPRIPSVPLHVWSTADWVDSSTTAVPVHPAHRTEADQKESSQWPTRPTDISSCEKLQTQFISAAPVTDYQADTFAAAGDTLSRSAVLSSRCRALLPSLNGFGDAQRSEQDRSSRDVYPLMTTSPITPSDTNVDFFPGSAHETARTFNRKELKALAITAPDLELSALENLTGMGMKSVPDPARMETWPDLDALHWHQHAIANEHVSSRPKSREQTVTWNVESNSAGRGAVRNVSTVDMRIFSPEALFKLYQSFSTYEQRLFVRLAVPPACIDDQLVSLLMDDQKSDDADMASLERTDASGNESPRSLQNQNQARASSMSLSTALNMLVEEGLLRRTGSCYIANLSWRQFVQQVADEKMVPALVTPEIRKHFCEERHEAQACFVKWILDRLHQDAPVHPDGLRFDESVANCIQRWCAESKNLLAALAFAAADKSPLLPQLLLRGYDVMRICIPPELRVEYLKIALRIVQAGADSESMRTKSEITPIESVSEKPQCMLVQYMPQSEEEAMLLEAIGESHTDSLSMAEAEIPLCQALRFFIGALAQSLGVSNESIEKLDDVCLDEEIARIQQQFQQESAEAGGVVNSNASQLNELTRKCQARMALLRMDMLLEVFQESFSDRCSDLSFVTTDHRSASSLHSPSTISGHSSRGKSEIVDSHEETSSATSRRLLLRCVLPLLLLSQRIGLEGFRSEANDLLIMSLRILSALGLSQSTLTAAALLSVAGIYLSSGQLMRARDVCYRALDVLREGNFTSFPVYADALGMLGAVELIEGQRPAAIQRFGAALRVLESWLESYAGLPHEHCLSTPQDVQHLPLQHCRELHLWLSIGLARTCRAQQQNQVAERISRVAVNWWRRVQTLAPDDPKGNPDDGKGSRLASSNIDDLAYMEAVSLLPPAFQDFGYLRHVH